MIDVKSVPEVNVLGYDADTGLTLGAAVECYKVYAVDAICDAYPGLIDATQIIGGTAIQGRASIGGNLCNASPAGGLHTAVNCTRCYLCHRRSKRRA